MCEGREGDPLAARLLQQALVLVEHFLRDLVLKKEIYNKSKVRMVGTSFYDNKLFK